MWICKGSFDALGALLDRAESSDEKVDLIEKVATVRLSA
jgi:hypothetical protein